MFADAAAVRRERAATLQHGDDSAERGDGPQSGVEMAFALYFICLAAYRMRPLLSSRRHAVEGAAIIMPAGHLYADNSLS